MLLRKSEKRFVLGRKRLVCLDSNVKFNTKTLCRLSSRMRGTLLEEHFYNLHETLG